MVLRQTSAVPASLSAKGARVLILEAPYYADITRALADGALAAIAEAGASSDRLAVPGALELPQALAALIHAERIGRFAGAGKVYDGVVVLGCVIRGETAHFEVVINNANHWLMKLAVKHGVPLGNGLLTMDTQAQAWARAEPGKGNKGADAARACLRLIEIERELNAGAKV